MLRCAQQFTFALLLNLCAVPLAIAADWQVVRTAGVVWVVPTDAEPVRAAAGMILPADATVATMSGARATLQHGEDLLNLGPNTSIAPQAREVRGLTTVLMPEGELELDIESRNRPHFSVQTPVLAAVVKGTLFTVTASGGDAGVALQNGRVQVTALATGQTVDLESGQSANVGAGGMSVSGEGALPSIQSAATQAPMVEAAVAPPADSGTTAGSNSGESNAASEDYGEGEGSDGVDEGSRFEPEPGDAGDDDGSGGGDTGGDGDGGDGDGGDGDGGDGDGDGGDGDGGGGDGGGGDGGNGGGDGGNGGGDGGNDDDDDGGNDDDDDGGNDDDDDGGNDDDDD